MLQRHPRLAGGLTGISRVGVARELARLRALCWRCMRDKQSLSHLQHAEPANPMHPVCLLSLHLIVANR